MSVQKGQILISQQQTDVFLDDPIELVTRFVVTHDWLLQSRGERGTGWCPANGVIINGRGLAA